MSFVEKFQSQASIQDKSQAYKRQKKERKKEK
jgi:hypothetical protein